MAEIRDYVVVDATLQTASAPAATFGINMLLVDDPQIPRDLRYISAFSSDFSDVLEGSLQDYATVYFGQKRKPESVLFGRWLSTLQSPEWFSGPSWDNDPASWSAAGTTDIILALGVDNLTLSGVEFTGVTTTAQIAQVIQTAIDLAAPAAPFDEVYVDIDSKGRLHFLATQSALETDNLTVTFVETDFQVLIDASNVTSLAGAAGETALEAIEAISDIRSDWYNLHVRNAEEVVDFDDQMVELAAFIETQEKLMDLVVTDTSAKVEAVTNDLGARIKALGYKRTLCIYTEHGGQFPDAAVVGAVLPALEGSTSFAFEVLTGVTESGLNNTLPKSVRKILKDKGYNYIETVGNNTFMYDGVTAGNEEKRIMLGRDWFTARIAEAIFTDQLNVPVNTFDNDTLTKIGQFILTIKEEAVRRKILIETADRPFTLNLPDADDIPVSQRAARKLEIQDAFTGYINSAINDYVIVGTWRL